MQVYHGCKYNTTSVTCMHIHFTESSHFFSSHWCRNLQWTTYLHNLKLVIIRDLEKRKGKLWKDIWGLNIMRQEMVQNMARCGHFFCLNLHLAPPLKHFVAFVTLSVLYTLLELVQFVWISHLNCCILIFGSWYCYLCSFDLCIKNSWSWVIVYCIIIGPKLE